MRIAAELHTEDPGHEREVERKHVGMRVGFRKRGYDQAKAEILDISIKGFKVDTAMALGIDSEVWLKLPGMEPKPAKVTWSDGFTAGCAFLTPLHEAVLEDFLKRNRDG